MAKLHAFRDPSQPALLSTYRPGHSFCELIGDGEENRPRLLQFWQRLEQMALPDLTVRAADAVNELFERGVTFTVYSDRDAIDRTLPFDVIPRVLTAAEWKHIEAGVKQRVAALNLFLTDLYGAQKILDDGIVPRDLILSNPYYRPEMRGFTPPRGVYVHVAGIDLVRGRDGEFLVLEDNARTPSGVSYVIENRHLMQRAFPDLIEGFSVRDVSEYGQRLREKLAETAPEGVMDPQIVLLSPGVFNSAYYEHIFLAREMGVPLVEGRDLLVKDKRLYARTISGLHPVDVVYRRVDDAFLDPEAFNPESMLGVPGLMSCLRAGTVTVANMPGTGVADDKAVYAYMPRIIQYYLGEEAILPNVDTYICREEKDLAYVLENLGELVVKPVGESGGYGIVVGPKASAAEIEACRKVLLDNPANFIAQPMIDLSVCPTLTDEGVAPRHVDLRPFAVTGKDTWVLPGGLTRVALRKGSIIVNSSQGGGTKDTWVLYPEGSAPVSGPQAAGGEASVQTQAQGRRTV
ncbi:MAG: circularly permuted type 2 ATP-grasp protein [Hyphomicrobiaceae bacterium]|nr:circularly permuted type 2 ATP-grasp protein [Hyphomicrobiaceae bacterium]